MQLGSVGLNNASLGLEAGVGSSGKEFNAAVTSHVAGSGTGQSQGGDGKLDRLLQELISILQPGSGGCSQRPPASESQGRPLAGDGDKNAPPADDSQGNERVASNSQGNGRVGSDLSTVISLLNNALTSGSLGPQEKALVEQLLPMLEDKLVSMEQSGGQGSMTGLLKQLITALGGQGQEADGSHAAEHAGGGNQKSADFNPTVGIGADEMDAMIANANGEGPAVDFSQY